MIKIVIAILVVAGVIDALIVYACCVAAGRADDAAERMRKEDSDG